MKTDIEKIIEIPDGIEVNVDGTEISAKGKEGENKRKFNIKKIKIEKQDGKLRLFCKNGTKKEKKIINTIASHIKNMIVGVGEKFEYKLKICTSHFPITVEVKEDEAVIKNFLGEKIPRKVKIPAGVEVENDKQEIKVKSVDKELAGQTAANFERATRIPMKDRRVFQDGIFMTSKSGREI